MRDEVWDVAIPWELTQHGPAGPFLENVPKGHGSEHLPLLTASDTAQRSRYKPSPASGAGNTSVPVPPHRGPNRPGLAEE